MKAARISATPMLIIVKCRIVFVRSVRRCACKRLQKFIVFFSLNLVLFLISRFFIYSFFGLQLSGVARPAAKSS